MLIIILIIDVVNNNINVNNIKIITMIVAKMSHTE